MMTWNEARRQLRNGIEKYGDFSMQVTQGRGPVPPFHIDPSNLNNPKYSAEHRFMIARMLSYNAVKDCSARSLNGLLSGIDDPDPGVRRIIAEACGACGYAPAIPGLIRKLNVSNDRNEIERIEFALTAMGESAVCDLVDLIIDIYQVEGDQVDENIQYDAAIGALVEMGPDVVDWLLKYLHDEHPERWQVAIMVCRSNFREITIRKIREIMDDHTNFSNNMLIMSRIGQILRLDWSLG